MHYNYMCALQARENELSRLQENITATSSILQKSTRKGLRRTKSFTDEGK